MGSDAQTLITEHIDLWTSAIQKKKSAGRGSSKKHNLYGIKKLRELILELAVRGKLVPQDPNDEPASVLLERIAVERDRLVKAKKIKKPKKLAEVTIDEIPFELPKGWEWVRLSNAGYCFTGKTPSTRDLANFGGDISFVGPGQISLDGKITSSEKGLTDKGLLSSVEGLPGDILMVCIGGSIGKCAITETRIAFNQQINSVRPIYIGSKFLNTALSSNTFFQTVLEKASGSATPIINRSKWEELLVPVAPLYEQQRIVAKVDELMTLCDRLEAQTEKSITAHQILVETLLGTLTQSQNADELAENWQRLAEHFDTLFTTEHSIDQLKQTILQLAVMGKLVPQDPNDEPASVLLERIATEKEQLIKDKKIKKHKPLPSIAEDGPSAILPDGWKYVHLQELCTLITDGTHQTPKYTDTGRPFVSAQCVKPFRFMPSMCRYVSEDDYQGYIKNRKPEYQDILLARVGAGIGEAALIDTDLEFAIYVSTGLLKPHKTTVLPEYLVIWLNSPIGRQSSERNTYGKGVSQGNLNLSLIRGFIVSLPPYLEQKRIVDKTNQLVVICDQLKARLQESQQTQLSLAAAITDQALQG